MAKYAQIEDLKNGKIFRVVEETAGEVYFYDEFRRWCYFNKSEEGVNYRYIPAVVRPKKTSTPKTNKIDDYYKNTVPIDFISDIYDILDGGDNLTSERLVKDVGNMLKEYLSIWKPI